MRARVRVMKFGTANSWQIKPAPRARVMNSVTAKAKNRIVGKYARACGHVMGSTRWREEKGLLKWRTTS